MRLIVLDQEQADIIMVAADAAVKMLEARLGRADPEGIISKSCGLQRRKIEQMQRQMEMPAFAKWHELPAEQRARFVDALSKFRAASTDDVRAAHFETMAAFLISSRQFAASGVTIDAISARPPEDPSAPEDAGAGA